MVARVFEAITCGDIEALRGGLSDDPSLVFIGTDDEEWWVGKAPTLAIIQAQVEESPGESYASEVENDEVHAWSQGGLGWAVGRGTVTSAVGRRFATRFTAVFHLEGLQWRLVHAHVSSGQRNEELWGFAVTTSPDAIAVAVDAERPDLTGVAAGDGTVTIVFTDIEASTQMAERLGDAGWMELLRWHDRVVEDGAERHRGRVVKSEGDGYMLAFASATGALDFAQDLQARTAEGFAGESVRVRVGVNAGDVIAERDDFFGHAVTVAARVVAKARGGETVVTDPVSALVAGVPRFRFSEPRATELKGLSGEFRLRTLAAVG